MNLPSFWSEPLSFLTELLSLIHILHPWDPGSLTAGKKTKAPPSPSPFGKSLAGNDEPYREPLYCYRYTLSFDEAKLLKDWKREECVPRTSEDETASQ